MLNKLRQLFFLALLLSITSCQSKVFKDELGHILGVEEVEIEESQGTNEFGGFGEGHSLEVYVLSERTVQAFVNKASKTLPNKNDDEAWQKYDWDTAPFDSTYNEIMIMSLNYSSGNRKLETQLNDIKQVLKKGDNYYSFYYKPDKENPQDVQLFVLDVHNKKLYITDSSF